MKRTIFLIIVLITALSMYHSLSAMYSLWKKQDVLIRAREQLVKAQKENQTLKKQLHTVSSPSFVEQEARNKLFMVKQGENTVFIARNLLLDKSGKIILPKPQSNLEQWFHLFFY